MGRREFIDFETGSLWPGAGLVDWQQDPLSAFDAWLVSQPVATARQFRETSRDTYRAYFASWLAYLNAKHCGLLEATRDESADYFATHPLEPVSRRRYLQLLDRVYRSLRELGWSGSNPMTSELMKERTLDIPGPDSLSAADVAKLQIVVDALPEWNGRRDRAMLALLVGAGLRANEVMSLPRTAVGRDFSVDIRPGGVHRAHRSVILPGAWREAWTDWESSRADLGVLGPLAFPSAKSGRPYSVSGLFRRIDTWLDLAQIKSETRGANLLRNTFARLALERHSPEQVQEFMGHEEIRATLRYQSTVD